MQKVAVRPRKKAQSMTRPVFVVIVVVVDVVVVEVILYLTKPRGW